MGSKCCGDADDDKGNVKIVDENEAATKIQARFRGNMVRKRASQGNSSKNPHIPDPTTA